MYFGKRLNIKLALLIISLLLSSLFFHEAAVFAEDRSYEISKYNIGIVIHPDGSADIEESIRYNFDGRFSGVFRDVDFSSTNGMENPKVFIEHDGNRIELKLNSINDLNADGINGTYNLVNEGEIAKFKIFERSEDENKNFIFQYTFRDVITKYNDIAEFNRKMIDRYWDVTLKDITINFTLPEGATREELKVFGHGSLLGESKIIDSRHVEFKVPRVVPGDMVETLVLFPTKLVPDSKKIVNKDALPEIMANEKVLAEEANRQREKAKEQIARKAAMRSIGNIITLVFAIVWFGIIIYIYRKYDKELKHSFEGKYYRELPGDYTPAEMSYLLSMGNVATSDITATLMDLVRKKHLILKASKTMQKGLFRSKEVEEYVLSINPKAPAATLKSHESFLIQWFVNSLGDGNSVNLDEISDYTKTKSNARHFKDDYDNWCRLAKAEAKKNLFLDDTSNKGRTIGILLSVVYLILGILLLFIFQTVFALILLIQFIILFIFSVRISRRTSYGNEQKAMWDAFRNFLKDFSRMDKAEIPSIVIWEHYLVYAISLGVAKEVIKQFPLVFSEADLQDNRLTYMYGYNNFAGFSMLSNSLDRTVDSVDHSINNAMAVANSTLSSSSGGGGGFSGGSSGGGGGGGGGGAF